MPTLHLAVTCDATAWGESVGALGSWNNWDKSAITLLSTTPTTYPTWRAAIPLPPTSGPVEYKYVITRDNAIKRWERSTGRTSNRTATPTQHPPKTPDTFDHLPSTTPLTASPAWNAAPAPAHIPESAADSPTLDALERAIINTNARQKSWRQRLSFIRSLFTDPPTATAASFTPANPDHLATVAIYLSFLSTNQIPCAEDGGHHRPNHHAHEARLLEAVLSTLLRPTPPTTQPSAYLPHIARKIFPHLPSYSSQFTVSVPLTRIRDIAHRGDIPHDLKQEIKHTLQNKLHRCAGPEDLHTSARLLKKINAGHYSPAFVDQFRIFHDELRAFFNASTLDDRLRYLHRAPATAPAAAHAHGLLNAKLARDPALAQLDTLTQLRADIAALPLMHPASPAAAGAHPELPTEDVQKTRLADIDLEQYAFLLLAGVAKDAEQHQNPASFPWSTALQALSLSLRNIALSGISPAETRATASELLAAHNPRDEWSTLRVKAAVDRALRFAESFSSAMSDVYSRRASSLGNALGVDRHAVAVFAEAEIRANITFQASRIADACARVCRKLLSLPPWDPLFAGRACGKLVHADDLSELRSDEGEAVVAVCKGAHGDEDIPPNVRGVVLGRSLPHLSHLGVRARQAGVVFVCAEDREVFEQVWENRNPSHVCMVVNARAGLASFTQIDAKDAFALKEQTEANGTTKGNIKTIDIKFDGRVAKPLSLTQVSAGTTSSKSAFAGKLYTLAQKSDGLFQAADGIALPHGMFQSQRAKHAKQYEALVKEYSEAFLSPDGDTDAAADALFKFIKSKFVLEERWCKAIQKSFDQGARVMVRSSANAEDLEDMSGAGLYDSLANIPVHSTTALQEATAAVWASLWTKRAASSRAAYGVPHNQVSMAVLVQQMVRADLSFVGFSRDPVSKDAADAAVYVEVAVGMGETLASATAAGSPYRFRIARDGMLVDTVSFASYGVSLVPDESGVGLRKHVVDYSKQRLTTSETFREGLVKRLAQTVLLLERAFGGPQDVEGAITVDSNRQVRVFVVQARPQIL